MAKVTYRGVPYDTDNLKNRIHLRKAKARISWSRVRSKRKEGGGQVNVLAIIRRKEEKKQKLANAQLVLARSYKISK